MSKKLLFGLIASVLTINAFAVSSTVTSQDYVDAKDALKQDLIPEAGVNYDENGGGVSVVTYTEEEGVIGERGIYRHERNDSYEGQEDSLVEARDINRAFYGFAACIEWDNNTNSCLLLNVKDNSDNYLPVYNR